MSRLFFLFLLLLFPSKLLPYEKPSLLSFGVGVFEIVRHNHNMTSEYRIEYKSGMEWCLIRPMVGFMMTARGATYLYGGFGIDWVIKKHFLFSPNFAAGWYNQGGGKNLGFPLEFRSGIECGWIFNNGFRMGVHFYHISNASLGYKNPVEESLDFFYSIPL